MVFTIASTNFWTRYRNPLIKKIAPASGSISNCGGISGDDASFTSIIAAGCRRERTNFLQGAAPIRHAAASFGSEEVEGDEREFGL
jgi:hypothetical protein